MKLTIRKKDSVTSILLFIFNIYFFPKGHNSIRLKSVFKVFEAFEKNETAIRMGLSRAVQNQLVSRTKDQGEVIYQLTEIGKSMIYNWWATIKDYRAKLSLQKQPWDRVWHLVIFSFPNAKQNERDELTKFLQSLGYGILNKGVWISPYDFSKEISQKVGSLQISEYIHLLSAQPEKEQKSSSIESSVWEISLFRQRYEALIIKIDLAQGKAEKLTAAQTLPILHELGLEFMKVISEDPLLPLEILGSWPAMDCVKKFMTLRERLIPIGEAFIEEILTQ
ncbi:transcriptional regulator [Desulfitobacterium metallireducens]|uniref:Uncharacterized protein n=1 Tax=Desulfitobacterium metallireducens DSM 15288 TaxID=871968 RepID=W0EGY3_9FIRM|nr:transcriptional regulator [Desulfitobacterium metallireducens]AHF08469.1 hypothetical protein DESME_04375 [Desulfitobacterium metallireducens DSM 15288]